MRFHVMYFILWYPAFRVKVRCPVYSRFPPCLLPASYLTPQSGEDPAPDNPTEPELERDKRQIEISEEWNRLISGIGKWKKALNDPQETGDKARTTLREKSLLGRPIGQLALVKGYAHTCILSGRNIDRKPLVRKLDSINWNMDADMWKGVLVKPNGKVMYGVRVANIAAKLIAHLIGAKLSKTDVERILDCIYGTKRRRKSLPVQI